MRWPSRALPLSHADMVASVEAGSRMLGLGITSFVMLYCTLNWSMYRRAREAVDRHLEEQEGLEKKKKKKPDSGVD